MLVCRQSGLRVLTLALWMCGGQAVRAAGPLRFEPVAQIGGALSAVAVDGNRAYIGQGGGLRILDLADPQAPLALGHVLVSGEVAGVAVVAPYAYVVTTAGRLEVINMSDALAPRRVGAALVGGESLGVAVAGSYAYLAGGEAGLLIFDVSNPSRPVKVAGVLVGGRAWAVRVAGTHAFVAADEAGLAVVDVSDPSQPVQVGGLETGGQAVAIARADAFVYLADTETGVHVIDVSNPTNPTRTGVHYTGRSSPNMHIAVSGAHAYVAREAHVCPTCRFGPPFMAVIDVSDPANPNRVGSYTILWSPRGLAVVDRIALLVSSEALHVVDGDCPIRS